MTIRTRIITDLSGSARKGLGLHVLTIGGQLLADRCLGTAKKRSSTRRSSGKRDLVASRSGKSFAKRSAKGRFKEMDNVKRSLSKDRRKKRRGK